MSSEETDERAWLAQTNLLLRREALRRAAAQGLAGAPATMESTLSSISDEVTAEAVARLAREKASK